MSTEEISQRLQPEWRHEYDAYLEAHKMGFESYESSIHQDGFAAGWTLGIEAVNHAAAGQLAAALEQVERLREALEQARVFVNDLLIGSIMDCPPPWPGVQDSSFAPLVVDLCERVGYGAVIQTAAYAWQCKDPIGGRVEGTALCLIQSALKQIDAALAATPAPAEGSDGMD